MSRNIYFSSDKSIHSNHEAMYCYDSPFYQFANFTHTSEISFKNGKSAYEIAVDLGFQGTAEEWINSLKGTNGISPHIEENGNWFIGDIDTGVSANNKNQNIESISNTEIDSYFINDNSTEENIQPLSIEELNTLFI